MTLFQETRKLNVTLDPGLAPELEREGGKRNVLVSSGCRNKNNTTDLYFLTVLVAGSPRSE